MASIVWAHYRVPHQKRKGHVPREYALQKSKNALTNPPLYASIWEIEEKQETIEFPVFVAQLCTSFCLTVATIISRLCHARRDIFRVCEPVAHQAKGNP